MSGHTELDSEPCIRVGIITAGEPEISRGSDRTVISNVLIGEGFHWAAQIKGVYEGELQELQNPQGNIHVLNILPLERYLMSVISSEMNPRAPIEFMKAHAVISRSWAMRKICHKDETSSGTSVSDINTIRAWEESDSHKGFDVCSDDHCQRYQGLTNEVGSSERAAEAITSTRGEVLMDAQGDIADARFYKCCGGMTEIFSSCWADRDYSYLVSQSDPWCDLSDMNDKEKSEFLCGILKDYDRSTIDFHDWEETVTKSGIASRLMSRHGIDIGEVKSIRALDRGASGRLISLLVEGSKGSVTVGKELAIRRLLSERCLRSSWFEPEDTGENIILRGHGWGHGVGLCQIGAARMAREGKNYKEILGFYYPGAIIRKIYE